MGAIEDRKLAKKDLTKNAGMFRSICEVLREVYDDVYLIEDNTIRDRVTENLTDAFVMAKKMDRRLGYYYKTYSDQTGKKGTGLQRVGDFEGKRNIRRERPRKW